MVTPCARPFPQTCQKKMSEVPFIVCVTHPRRLLTLFVDGFGTCALQFSVVLRSFTEPVLLGFVSWWRSIMRKSQFPTFPYAQTGIAIADCWFVKCCGVVSVCSHNGHFLVFRLLNYDFYSLCCLLRNF